MTSGHLIISINRKVVQIKHHAYMEDRVQAKGSVICVGYLAKTNWKR